MSRSLDDLDSRFRPRACELIARCVDAGIAVLIIDTLRTLTEQEENIRKGVSWTVNSKHLPQPVHCPACGAEYPPGTAICGVDGTELPPGKSLAIDLAPFKEYYLYGRNKIEWDGKNPAWYVMGSIGESLHLRWGGRWKEHPDLGHFEWVDS